MGLRDIIAGGVKIANNVTKDLQPYVTHEPFVSADVEGTATFGPAVSRRALVEWKQEQVRTPSGQLVMSKAKVTFLEPVTVTYLDQITLPDGTINGILSISGFTDSKTNGQYFTEVWFG